MYEVTVVWEHFDVSEQPPYIREFAEIWRAADKIVYSRTLETKSSARTVLRREFDADTIRRLKDAACMTSRSAAPIWPPTKRC